MNSSFIELVYKSIVQENCKVYEDILNIDKISEKTIPFWRDAISLYKDLDDNQRNIFMSVIQSVIIDTISNVFGVIDGSTNLEGHDFDISLCFSGISSEKELQDNFIEFAEKINNLKVE